LTHVLSAFQYDHRQCLPIIATLIFSRSREKFSCHPKKLPPYKSPDFLCSFACSKFVKNFSWDNFLKPTNDRFPFVAHSSSASSSTPSEVSECLQVDRALQARYRLKQGLFTAFS